MSRDGNRKSHLILMRVSFVCRECTPWTWIFLLSQLHNHLLQLRAEIFSSFVFFCFHVELRFLLFAGKLSSSFGIFWFNRFAIERTKLYAHHNLSSSEKYFSKVLHYLHTAGFCVRKDKWNHALFTSRLHNKLQPKLKCENIAHTSIKISNPNVKIRTERLL